MQNGYHNHNLRKEKVAEYSLECLILGLRVALLLRFRRTRFSQLSRPCLRGTLLEGQFGRVR